MSCLHKRRQDLNALSKILINADATIVLEAVQASSSLTGVAICANEQTLRSPYPPPKSIESKAKVDAIRERLSEVEALSITGAYQKGLVLAKKLEEQANSVDYLPVRAELLYRLGTLHDRLGEYKKAEETLYRAVSTAGKVKDSLLAGQALVLLVPVVGYIQLRYDAALSLGKVAGYSKKRVRSKRRWITIESHYTSGKNR